MHIIPIENTSEKYNIYIKDALIESSSALFGPLVHGRTAYIITDAQIYELHGTPLVQNLLSAGATVHVMTLESGENAKKLSRLEKLYSALLDDNINENDILIGFGGRSIQDITGFTAATLFGGIRYICVPTTIASQAFLFPGGYPMLSISHSEKHIGVRHLPVMVLSDPTVLKSLPPKEQSCGMAEIIQHAAICDSDLFRLIETFGVTPGSIANLIAACCKKREDNIRISHLFGKEYADALRKASCHAFHYAEAISVAMAKMAQVGVRDLKTSEESMHRLIRLLNKFALPTELTPDDTMQTEKELEATNDANRPIVFMTEIGNGKIYSEPISTLLPKAYANRRRLEFLPSVPQGTVRIPPCRDISLKMQIAAYLSKEENPVSGQGLLHDQMKEALQSLSCSGELPGGEQDIIMHYLLPLALTINGGVTIHGEGIKNKHKLAPILSLLDAQGIVCHTEDNCFTAYGRLHSGEFHVKVSESPYLVCGLLLTIPLLNETSTLTIEGDLTYMFHVEMTLEIMKKYGIFVTRLTERTFSIRGGQTYLPSDVPRFVGGDYGIASPFWLMGALGADVGCLVLADGKNQPSANALSIAENFGATILQEGGRIALKSDRLMGAGIDLAPVPELFPYILALSACAEGESRLFNADVLKSIDYEKFARTVEAFTSIGVLIHDEGDYLSVMGQSVIPGGVAEVKGDPILALCLGSLCTKASDKIILLGGQSVFSVMPDYLTEAQALGILVSILGEIE